jgi:putative ABC transport system permease protein
VDFVATLDAFRARDPQLHALAFERGAARLGTQNVSVSSEMRALADRIFDDQQLIYVGVAVGAGELLLICWFALFLAVSQTSPERRPDVGLLKMRGVRRRDVWRLLAGQSVIPLAAGGVVGLVAGPALAWWTGGGVVGDEIRQAMWVAVLATTALAVVGAVVAALVAERRMLRESVSSLGRGVVGHRRNWRSSVFDALVVLVAAAAVYQVKAGSSGGGLNSRGVELAAPILLALAVGVLSARLIPVAAAWIGRRALRAGRVSTGLAAMHLARRPGTTRVLGLVAVVVAVLAGTAQNWSAADRARHERALFEVGDDRVLTVEAPSSARLLAAVRQADPSGKYAMAVVESQVGNPLLALDATRMAAVLPQLPAYGLADWPSIAAALHPATTAPVGVNGGALDLDVTWSSPSPAGVSVVATLQATEGPATTVAFGPLRAGRHTYPAPATNCSAGCRLVSLTVTSGADRPPADSVATVHAIGGVSAAGLFGDRTRWRADVVEGAQIPRITTSPDGLAVTITTETLAGGTPLHAGVYVLDATTPVPVVSSGDFGLNSGGDPRTALTDSTAQPVRIVARAALLPRIGTGLLVDLEYADRLAAIHTTGTMQVWLAAGAPDSLTRQLTDAGLKIVAEQSVADRVDTLAAQGPPAALRFLLLVGFLGVLLALISFAVMAAVEKRTRSAELSALRRQGMRQTAVRRIAVGGYAALIVAAVVVGAVTAAVLTSFFPTALPVFGDNWQTLPAPGAAGYALPAAAGLILVLLGILGALSALSLTSTVRHQTSQTSSA